MAIKFKFCFTKKKFVLLYEISLKIDFIVVSDRGE